jgi:hypothetical protein
LDHSDCFLGRDLLYNDFHLFFFILVDELRGCFLLGALSFFVGTIDLMSLFQLTLNILDYLPLRHFLQIFNVKQLDVL